MRLKSRTGFTLIEMIMVMAIIFIIYMTAAPAFKSYNSQKVDLLSKKFISDLNYARSLAMEQPLDATYGVRRAGCFLQSSPASVYAIYLSTYTTAVVDPINPAKKLLVTLNTGDYRGVSFNGISYPGVSAGSSGVEFDSRGRPCDITGRVWTAGDGDMVIAMKYQGQTANLKTIHIEPQTGRIYKVN